MKKHGIIASLFAAMLLTSCGLTDLVDAFKNIEEILDGSNYDYTGYPGMGASTERLQGTEFTLPNGIEIEETIYGYVGSDDSSLGGDNRGSGTCVVILVKLRSDNAEKTKVTFPQGLTTQASSSSYQNGILVKSTSIDIAAKSTAQVILHFYCLNANSSTSDSNSQYGFGPITNIKQFEPLFEVANGKKINTEEHKSSEYAKYVSTTTTVQSIVWAITHGKEFSKSDIKEFMKNVDSY